MKIVIAEDTYEGLEQVGIYKDGKLVYQYDNYDRQSPDTVEILKILGIDVQLKSTNEEWFYKHAEEVYPRLLKDVKWKK